MKCWVSAGFGFVAVKGGDGPEHDGGSSIHEHQGPVDLGDFGGAVTQKTNNLIIGQRVSGFHPRSPLCAHRAGGTRQVDLPPARFKVCGSRELRSVQGEEEQGTSCARSRRVEAYRRIEEGVQQGTVDSPRQGALKS